MVPGTFCFPASVHASVLAHSWSLLTRYLISCFWGFDEVQFRTKMNCSEFETRRSKVTGHSETKCTFLVEAYWSVAFHQRPSSYFVTVRRRSKNCQYGKMQKKHLLQKALMGSGPQVSGISSGLQLHNYQGMWYLLVHFRNWIVIQYMSAVIAVVHWRLPVWQAVVYLSWWIMID